MFREAKEVDFQTSHAAQYASTLLRPTRAEVLVLESSFDFRQAHRLVGHLVRRHLAGGDLNRLTLDELTAAAEQVLGQRIAISQAALDNALDPEAAVLARAAPGGAAAEAVDTMVAQCEQALAEAEAWTSDCRR
jgi:argininosuccinate lyase